jgi:hypothetical protein
MQHRSPQDRHSLLVSLPAFVFTNPKAHTAAAPPATPTGIDYLRLVEDRHTSALGRPRTDSTSERSSTSDAPGRKVAVGQGRSVMMGKLQYRQGSVHDNLWLRLLRTEVEALVKTTRGDDYLKERQTKTALAQIDHELNGLRTQVAACAGSSGCRDGPGRACRYGHQGVS